MSKDRKKEEELWVWRNMRPSGQCVRGPNDQKTLSCPLQPDPPVKTLVVPPLPRDRAQITPGVWSGYTGEWGHSGAC